MDRMAGDTCGRQFHLLLPDRLKYEVWAGVAYYQYDFPLPATASELQQFMQTHPDARIHCVVDYFRHLGWLAMLFGAILVALFGEPKADKPVTPK